MSDHSAISTVALDQLFVEARTYYAWEPKPVDEDLLKAIYDLTKWGPTSANCCPLRIVFLTTTDGKARLLPALAEANRIKSETAGAVAIFAYDTEFYNELPKLFPHADAKSWFTSNDTLATETAFRNSSLQAGYFIMAARALGLDCGPMSGFNPDAVNAEFFPDGKFKVNFICNLGYGDGSKLYPRLPRLAFEDAATIL